MAGNRKKKAKKMKPFGAGTLIASGLRGAGEAIVRKAVSGAPEKVGVSAAAAAKALKRRKKRLEK